MLNPCVSELKSRFVCFPSSSLGYIVPSSSLGCLSSEFASRSPVFEFESQLLWFRVAVSVCVVPSSSLGCICPQFESGLSPRGFGFESRYLVKRQLQSILEFKSPA